MKRGWFGPRVLGWGFSPASWKGLLATAVFLIAFISALSLIDDVRLGWMTALAIFAVFLVVVNRTYDPDARTPF